ncbi:MAG TPA: hypothetical protein VMY06_14635 [Sedimentisphaerales bacterium]|nr:hypothetical protein [Sedimentisphaerales bacterium]HUU15542.1 hypothetical protein [Sedimentisphaerales bacterium]
MAENGNNPNVNICLVEQVENLAGQAMGLILQIEPKTNAQKKQLKKSADSLDEWQTTRLFGLRRAFE